MLSIEDGHPRQPTNYSMAGLDPAIQGHKLKSNRAALDGRLKGGQAVGWEHPLKP